MSGKDIETKVPGIKTDHRWITNRCLEVHGDDGAFDEAVKGVKATYRDTLRFRKINGQMDGVRFHLVLTTEEAPAGDHVIAAELQPGDLIWDFNERKHAIVKEVHAKRLTAKAEPTGGPEGTLWSYPPGRHVILVERASGSTFDPAPPPRGIMDAL